MGSDAHPVSSTGQAPVSEHGTCLRADSGQAGSGQGLGGWGVTLTPVSSTGQALDPLPARRGSHPHPVSSTGSHPHLNPLPEGEGVRVEVEGAGAGVRGVGAEGEGVGDGGRRGLGRVFGGTQGGLRPVPAREREGHPHPNPLPEVEGVRTEGEGGSGQGLGGDSGQAGWVPVVGEGSHAHPFDAIDGLRVSGP